MSGPVLAVFGSKSALSALDRRLKQVPSLSRMRGMIVLLDDPEAFAEADATMILNDQPDSKDIWTVLGAATRLGMISGRGVPRAYST